MAGTTEHVDAVIVAVLDYRADLGAASDLFKNPGIRSDSDIYLFDAMLIAWPP